MTVRATRAVTAQGSGLTKRHIRVVFLSTTPLLFFGPEMHSRRMHRGRLAHEPKYGILLHPRARFTALAALRSIICDVSTVIYPSTPPSISRATRMNSMGVGKRRKGLKPVCSRQKTRRHYKRNRSGRGEEGLLRDPMVDARYE